MTPERLCPKCWGHMGAAEWDGGLEGGQHEAPWRDTDAVLRRRRDSTFLQVARAAVMKPCWQFVACRLAFLWHVFFLLLFKYTYESQRC